MPNSGTELTLAILDVELPTVPWAGQDTAVQLAFAKRTALMRAHAIHCVKGIVQLAEEPDRPVVIHGVQHVFHPPTTLEDWPDDDRRTRMVFITKDLPEGFVRKMFEAFSGALLPDTPDATSMTDNPLAISGFTSPVR